MKKVLKITAFLLFLIISYLIILNQFPKDAGRFPFLVILFLSDYYLWKSFTQWLKNKRFFFRSIITLLYWLPLLLLAVLTVARMASFELIANESIIILLQGFIVSVYISKLIPVIFLLFSDLLKFIRFLIRKIHNLRRSEFEKRNGHPITRSKFLQQIGLAGGGLLFSGLLVGMFRWVHDFKVHHHRLKLPHLPNSFNRLRIVQISDLHLGSWTSADELENAVTTINNLRPDLIFFTGDLVNYKTDEAFRYENILSGLNANYGVFTILGNHDYGDYTHWTSAQAKENNMTDLFELYRRIGWKLLNNNNAIIEHIDGKIAIIGVENWGNFTRFPQYGDIEKAKKNTESADVKILLSHDPSHWEKIISIYHPDIDLTFSGHTHGFQFGVELKHFKWSPAQYAYKYWAGLYENLNAVSKKQYLYVNRGIGTIGYPGRVGILPEITCFELYT